LTFTAHGAPGAPEDSADLPRLVEGAQRALGSVRYGSQLRVGTAVLVLNPDSPLVTANMVTEVGGSPAAAAATLETLPAVFAEAGRREVVLVSSPSSLPEVEIVAEEAGYLAVEEGVVLTLRTPRLLVDHEPGARVIPLRERDESALAAFLIDAYGWPAGIEPQLALSLGHRLDDPRVAAFAAYEVGLLVGVALSFRTSDIGLVTELGVRATSRRRGLGRALASAAANDLLAHRAGVVAAAAEAGGASDRLWTSIGFVPTYETVTYRRLTDPGSR
jgi:GNAT superfamily N-acetyltransferase